MTEEVKATKRDGDIINSVLQGQGVFLTLRIGLYRAEKSLTPAEVGLADMPRGLVTAGHLTLLPSKICPELAELRTLENKARGEVENSTFIFHGLGRFLPGRVQDEFNAHMDDYEQRFWDLVERFSNRYEEYKKVSADFWREQAVDAGFPDPDHIEQLVFRAFLPKETMLKRFKFSLMRFRFPEPAVEAHKAALDAFDEQAKEFVEGTMALLRNEAATVLDEMSVAVASGKWNQRTLNRLPALLERVRNMQLVDDPEFTALLEEASERLTKHSAKDLKAGGEMDLALRKLQNGLSEMKGRFEDLAKQDVDIITFGAGRALDI